MTGVQTCALPISGRAVTLKAPKAAGATKVRLLGTPGPVRLSQSGGGPLRIEMPAGAPVGAPAFAFELTGVK